MLKMRFIWSIYSVTEQDRQEKKGPYRFLFVRLQKKYCFDKKKSKKMYSKSLLQSLSLQNFVYYNHFW